VNDEAKKVQRVYLTLTTLSTLSTSLIWGINTLFLLDAGLSNTAAFAANAFFTLGQVMFEVPTGVVADTWGRRTSYLLGALTLLVSTALYYWMWRARAPFPGWAATSVFLGLGYTFFSGATEAWLVDALAFSGYKGDLDSVFARGQVASGGAMLTGSVAGGFIAQLGNLGMPYLARSLMLALTFAVAAVFMKDLGFAPEKGTSVSRRVRELFRESVRSGLANPPVRWVMLEAPFTGGALFYAFYAMQPYLLELFGESGAYGVAGLAAAAMAGARIGGGLLVKRLRAVFPRRTQVMIAGAALSVAALGVIGLAGSFWVAVGLLVVWAMVTAAAAPVRQAYLNGIIPSKQRATVLSFDSLMASTGSVFIQPVLGRVADGAGYAASFLGAAAAQVAALPFLLLARRENAPSDRT
jgi:MFS family permease